MARRSARRRWGDLGGLKYLHFSCNFGGRRVVRHARYLVYDKGRRIAPRIPPGRSNRCVECCVLVLGRARGGLGGPREVQEGA